MKRILASIVLIFGAINSAHAGTCEISLMPAFTAQQAVEICTGIRGTLAIPGAITVTGLSTLNGQLAVGSETVAGAGTTVADAAQLSASVGVHRITGANGTVGWKFSSSTPVGSIQFLLNTTAGVALVYGETGSTVNGGSANAAFTALTGIKPIICVKTAALTYLCS
jgi:hypothetical protein